MSILKKLRTHNIMGVDIETSGLSPFDERIITLSVTVGGETEWWDVRKKLPPQELINTFADPRYIKVFHASIFDCTFLAWHFDWEFNNIFDTEVTENVILGIGEPPIHINKNSEEFQRNYSTKLNRTLPRYRLGKMDKEQQTSFVGMTNEPLTQLQIKYLKRDTEVLEPLMLKQLAKGKKLNLLSVIDLENKTAEVAYRMRLRGINFDEKYWLRLAAANEEKAEKMYKDLNRLAKNQVDNWNSTQQVKKFFSMQGIDIPSLSDLTLQNGETAPQFKGRSKTLDKFIEIRSQVYKYINTYGRGWLQNKWGTRKESPVYKVIGPDKRIHADIRQIVGTGRMSYSKPNLQQLPANTEGDPLHSHRKAFIPTKGYVFVSSDFSGQELGTMAALSKEQSWIDTILAGHDIHSVGAKGIYGGEWVRATKRKCAFPYKCDCPEHQQMREYAKTVNFGIPFGLTAKGLAEKVNVSRFEAQMIIDAWHRAAPTLSSWLKKNGETAIKTFEVRTGPTYNRRRSLELEPEEWRRRNQGYNTPIQGTGADMLKKALWDTHRYVTDQVAFNYVHPILCVHDEIITESVRTYAKTWVKDFKHINEEAAAHVLGISGLVKASPKIMKYWEPKKDIGI